MKKQGKCKTKISPQWITTLAMSNKRKQTIKTNFEQELEQLKLLYIAHESEKWWESLTIC